MKKYCFGIDVGGTSVKCGLFETSGTLVDHWEIPTNTENEGAAIVGDIAASIREELSKKQIADEEVEGVGIGVPGAVDKNGNVLQAVNLYWGFKPLKTQMEALTGFRVECGNDANVAALGEAWQGAAAGALNVIMVTLGTGVGGGIIVDGKILIGAHGAGGEIGHAGINHKETVRCNCGNAGCLEQYTSATGLVRVVKEALEETSEPSSLRSVRHLGAREILDAFKAGDAFASRMMEQFAERLGGALAVFATVTDPEAIVIGGGVSGAGQPLADIIQKYYRRYAYSICKDTPIVIATLGNEAGIYGAAKMVLPEK